MSGIIEGSARFIIDGLEFFVTYGIAEERERNQSLVNVHCSCCNCILYQKEMHKPLFGVTDVQIIDDEIGMHDASITLIGDKGDKIEEATLPFVLGVENALCDRCQEQK